MKNFIKRLVGFSLGPVLGAIISFITVPVTTFFISPEEFGKASMFTVVQSLIVTFIYLGMDQAYTREYHSLKDKRKLFQNAMLVPITASTILGLFMVLFRERFSVILFDSPNYTSISILFSLLIFSSVIERFILLHIRMEEKAVEYSLFSLFVKVTVLISTIILLMLGNRTFLTVVYSTIFGQLIGDAVLVIKYKNLFDFTYFSIDKKLVVKMLKFGVPLIIAASVSNLLNTSGRLFLRAYSTYHDLGIYNAALKIANLLQIFQNAFTSFWVPTAYRWNNEKKSLKHFSFISDILLLAMTLIFFLLLLSKKYITLILSSDYSEAQYVIGFLAIAPILYTLSETSTLGIVFSRKSYLNIWVSVFSLIPNILLNYLLVPLYGILGAAIANAAAYIIFCLSRTYFSHKMGFKIKFVKQIVNIFILFIVAMINVRTNIEVTFLTLILFIISMISQISTIKLMFNVKNNPDEWDFN